MRDKKRALNILISYLSRTEIFARLSGLYAWIIRGRFWHKADVQIKLIA